MTLSICLVNLFSNQRRSFCGYFPLPPVFRLTLHVFYTARCRPRSPDSKTESEGFGIGIFKQRSQFALSNSSGNPRSLFRGPGSRPAGTANQCRRVRPLSRNKETGNRGVIDREQRYRGGNGSRRRPSNRVPRGTAFSSVRKPSFPTRCRGVKVAPQGRGCCRCSGGISGSISATCSLIVIS